MKALRLALILAAGLCFSQDAANPWPDTAVLQPEALAKTLRGPGKKPVVISVAFPILYNSKHITGAIFGGPGRSAEGIELLKKVVAGHAKDADIVIYCGCCPMTQCPNMRPAFTALKSLGYTKVRVLNIPTNMATDWFGKDYPSEPGVAQ